MVDRPEALQRVRDILTLAHKDRVAASKRVSELGAAEQLALVCDTPVAQRRRILDLLPTPEQIVPLIPEAELCFTVKAIGLEDATWLLDLATPAQVVACVDLDAWSGTQMDRAQLAHWIDALADTSEASLLRALGALDAELLVLYLQDRIDVELKPNDDEGWQPPVGSRTVEGQFHVTPRRESDDIASLFRLLDVLFRNDYWTYFRAMQGAIWELPTETEEWAYRWRSGRLQDLGFPPWEEAMAIYRFVAAKDRARLPDDAQPLAAGSWQLPVWLPSLPADAQSGHLLFRVLARLSAEERNSAFYALVAVANQVAVADRMDLADSESTPRAIDKAATWITRGLELMADENNIDPAEALRRVPLQRLFRVGASLDAHAARPASSDPAVDVPTPTRIEDAKGPA